MLIIMASHLSLLRRFMHVMLHNQRKRATVVCNQRAQCILVVVRLTDLLQTVLHSCRRVENSLIPLPQITILLHEFHEHRRLVFSLDFDMQSNI